MTTQITSRKHVPALVTTQVDYILADGSASMQSKWWDTILALDEYLKLIRDGNVDTHVIATVFSNGADLDMVQRNGHIRDIALLGEDPALGSTFGGTALYDAIQIACRNLAQMRPERCHFIIATDGDEMDSRFTDITQAKALLNWCRAQGWQVTFIGCDFDNQAQADLLGADRGQSIGVSQAKLTDAAKEMARKRQVYAATGAPIHWSDEDKKQFGGYLGR